MLTTPIAAYVLCFIVFVAIDMVWLMGIGRGFYTGEIGGLLNPSPSLAAAALFYLIYPIGVVAFAIWPGFGLQSPMYALKYGALLGLVAYGTYDFTNMAVIKDFTWRITLIDLAWGTFLTGIVAALITRIMMFL